MAFIAEIYKNHNSSLIEFASDTAVISDFPINPVSFRRPYPEDRECFIPGEFLLWIADGIRNGYGYGSPDPFLIDTKLAESINYKGLRSDEILIARGIFKDWWDNYKDSNRKNINPLEDNYYRWFYILSGSNKIHVLKLDFLH